MWIDPICLKKKKKRPRSDVSPILEVFPNYYPQN